MSNLDDRLNKIEERLDALEKTQQITSQKPLSSAPIQEKQEKIYFDYLKTDISENKNSSLFRFYNWLKENWLIITGFLFVLLGFKWFLNFEFLNHLFSLESRFIFSWILGISLYGYGLYKIPKANTKGQIFLGLGITITLITFFLAHHMYQFLPPALTLIAMSLLIALTVWTALYYKLQWISFLSIFIGFATLLTLPSYITNSVFFYTYVLVVDMVAVFFFIKCLWYRPFHLACLFTVFSIPFYYYRFFLENAQFPSGLIFFPIYYLLFFIPVIFYVCKNKEQKISGAFAVFVINLGLINWVSNESVILFGLSSPYYQIDWTTSFYLLGIFSSIIGSYYVTKTWNHFQTQNLSFNPRVLGILIFWAIFWVIQLTNVLNHHFFKDETIYLYANLICYFVESLLAMCLGKFVLKSSKATTGLFLCFLYPLSWYIFEYWNIFYNPIYSIEFLTLCVACLTLSGARALLNTSNCEFTGRSILLLVSKFFSGLFLLNIIWIIVAESTNHSPNAVAIILILYVIIAECLIYFGNKYKIPSTRFAGLCLIFFVSCYLLMDAYSMSNETRVITFVIIGGLLIGTALFDKKQRHIPNL